MKSLQHLAAKLVLVATVPILILAAGCASEGEFNGQRTDTSVTLAGRNYTLIKASAEGTSYGFKLLGLIPITSPTYATAKRDLYDSVGESLTGRAVALANQTEDRSGLYLILFSIPKVTITADIIEFTDVAQNKAPAATMAPAAAPVTVPAAIPAPTTNTTSASASGAKNQ